MGEAEKVQILIPTIGESINEGTIGKWYFQEGDLVQKDQPLLEVDSDKATLEVPAAASGRLQILIPAGKAAKVGSLVGFIDPSSVSASAQSAKAIPTAATKTTASSATTGSPSPSTLKPEVSTSSVAKVPTEVTSTISAEQLKGFGPSKRRAIRDGSLKPSSSSVVNSPSAFDPSRGPEVRKSMSTLRKRIAERLLESQQTTATLTTFNEVDMSRAMAIRSQVKDSFQTKFGVKIGFMSFFSKAVVHALKNFPDVNARIEGGDIIYPEHVNLGIAVSTDRGLVVPVIREAEKLSYADLEKKIADLAERARVGKLSIPEMQGGTFTLTNGGVFGSLLSTPIINPPQSGILGMHKIEHRPIAIQNTDKSFSVDVRPMMYIALSYDHRLIDGATSVGFLVKVKEYLETLSEDAVWS